MFPKIKEKIEQINEQPEHVRVRYVWGCVVVSMIIVFSVWIFSAISLFVSDNQSTTANNPIDLKNQFQNMKNQTDSLKNIGQQSIDAINEVQKNTSPDSTSSSQESYLENNNTASGVPQSNSYTDLPQPSASTPTNLGQ